MRVKADLANRLQCALFMLAVACTAASGGVIYVDADTTGAKKSPSWENIYVYFIEFLQYPNFFAYDTIKVGSLRRYFDVLTVSNITFR